MTCFPIFFAVIENDLRRVLAYSMINQVGFMVCGIGIGTALALNGAVAHAFNDVIFKGLLFMTMGAVLYRVGNINGCLHMGQPYRRTQQAARRTGVCGSTESRAVFRSVDPRLQPATRRRTPADAGSACAQRDAQAVAGGGDHPAGDEAGRGLRLGPCHSRCLGWIRPDPPPRRGDCEPRTDGAARGRGVGSSGAHQLRPGTGLTGRSPSLRVA